MNLALMRVVRTYALLCVAVAVTTVALVATGSSLVSGGRLDDELLLRVIHGVSLILAVINLALFAVLVTHRRLLGPRLGGRGDNRSSATREE